MTSHGGALGDVKLVGGGDVIVVIVDPASDIFACLNQTSLEYKLIEVTNIR